jgi:ribose/xylose/arabinose/galactoside ABC-type transport system permease subunit/ABC-type sugar transport system substrate-binding protein
MIGPMIARLGSRAQGLLILALLALLLGVASPHFLTADNLLNVLQQSSINALLGVGLTFVIISGGIDLSVGSILAFCGLVVAELLVRGVAAPLAVGAGLALGLACGAVNGLITTLARIPPFIVTLGMMLVARSAAKIFCDSKPISGLPESFRALSGDLLGVPVLVIVVIVCYALAHVALTRTKLGRYTYAIGGNEQAAWLSGVSVGTTKVAVYALSGLMAGAAAVLMTSRLNAASPLAGEMYELYAIAAAVIGGVSLMGGEGHVFGTLIGALVMGTLRNGLNLLNVPSAWEGLVVGAVLVVAVVVDRSRHRDPSAVARAGRRRALKLVLVGASCLALVAGAALLRGRGGGGKQLTVAFVPKSIGEPFWVAMQRAAEREAARQNVRLVTLASERETDVERQFQVIENLIRQRVDAIILAPAGSREIVLAIRKANEAGIPVLIVDSDIDRGEARRVGVRTATYIGSDNVLGGRIAGRYLAQALGGKGQIAILEGTAGHESTDRRVAGFREALAAHPGLRVVASQTANAERERGYTVAQNILQAQPQLDAIFGANDQMALGALEAVDAARRLGRVRVVGFDASPDAIKNIRARRMLGSLAQFPDEMGRLGVLHAVQLVRGGVPPPAVIHTKVEMVDAASLSAGQR